MAAARPTTPLATEHGDPAIVANAAIWTMTGVATAFLAVRLACRCALTRMWWDDYVLAAGLAATVAASAVFSELLRLGFARTAITGERISLLLLVLDSVQKFSLACTKTSFSLTLLHVFTPGWQRWLVLALLVVLDSYIAFNMCWSWVVICEGHLPNRITTTCITAKNQATLNTIVLSATCDFILAFLPWQVIRKLQMRPMERVGAALAMGLGSLAGVAGIIKGVQTFHLMDHRRPDFFYQLWVFQVWNIAEPCITVVAASIPVLRGFVRGTRARNPPATLPAAGGPYSMSNGVGKFSSHAGASADEESESSVQGRWNSSQEGITRVRRFTVEFDPQDIGQGGQGAYELHPAHRGPDC